jgi:transposase-like protein
MENNSTTEERKESDKQSLVETLKEMPIIQIACKKSGISRATYYRWRQEDKNFLRQSEDAMAQGFEFINDMSESQVVTLIKEKKLPAIALWLKHHHPRYGSKIRSYSPVTSREDLTPEENSILLEALKLASGGIIEDENDNNKAGIY